MSSDDGSGNLTQPELDHIQHVQQVKENIYLGIQIVGGHIALPILVLTILLVISRRVQRRPIFISFCISWILSSVIYSLPLYRGRSADDLLYLNPANDICLIQAFFISGVQTMTSCTNLALVLDLWQLLRKCPSAENKAAGFTTRTRKERLIDYALLVIPYIVFLSFTISTIMIGRSPAENADGSGIIPGSNLAIPGVFYCIILENANFSHSLVPGLKTLRSVLIFSCFISLITVGFEVTTAILAFRRRAFLKSMTFSWTALFLRVVFSAYRIVAVSLNIVIIVHPDELLFVGIARDNLFNGVIDFFNAATPLVAFVVFASEKDIWSVWCFWRKFKCEGRADGVPSSAGPEVKVTRRSLDDELVVVDIHA